MTREGSMAMLRGTQDTKETVMTRSDGRRFDELRPYAIHRGVSIHAEGSARVECGNTIVLCTASVEERVPPWLRGRGSGWVTAEYGMLPRATSTRSSREASKGKQDGRTVEIQRLIGRSLRAVAHMPGLGERAIWLDCDVLQADGGTRCAAITGAFVALADALIKMRDRGLFPEVPLYDTVAAVSVGQFGPDVYLDLPHEEDSRADVDMNVVATGDGRMVEVQGTAEGEPFARNQLDAMLDRALAGCSQLRTLQREALPEVDWEGLPTVWARAAKP